MLLVKLGGIAKGLRKLLRKQKLRKLILEIFINYFDLRIVTKAELATREKYQTFPFGSAELIFAENSGLVDELPKVVQSSIGLVKLEQPFVSEVKNARIVGPTAAVFDAERHLIEESLPSSEDLPIRALIAQKLFIANTPKLHTACSLVNSVNHVYGHWISDCLMRLEGVEHYQKMTGRKPIIFINPNLKSWQIDSLKLLGYEPSDYIQWDYNLKGFNVETIIVPSFRRQGTWIEPSACQWLKQRIFSNLPPVEKPEFPVSPRIYISRMQEFGRAVVNEDEVMEVLRPYGFVSYTLENMNFIEEVRLFSQAEIIVGTHGSGLINMVFSQNKPTIIDLFSSWYTDWFFNLSISLGCQYACLKCQPSGQDFRLTRDNVIVDAAKLKQLIERVLLHSD